MSEHKVTSLSDDATISRLEREVIRLRKDSTEQRHELARIARILRDFHAVPLSLSSIQPLLDLAVELNPDLSLRQVAR